MKTSTFVVILCCFTFLGVVAQQKQTVTYAIKDGQELQMDIYIPEAIPKGKKLPTLVWMHGGGFSSGVRDNNNEVQLCEKAVEEGFVAVSISYRLLRKGTKTAFGCDCPAATKEEVFKQAAIDYMDAVRYLIDHHQEFNSNPNQLIAGGSSAGAEAILSAVYMPEYYGLEAYEDISFAGVFSLAGALVNLNELKKNTSIPTVLFHGIADNLVPYSKAAHHYCHPNQAGYLVLNGSDKIIDRLDRLGESYLFYSYKKGRHEIAGIPFEDLTDVFSFFKSTIINKQYLTKTILR